MKYPAQHPLLRRGMIAVGTALLVAACNGSGLTVAGGGIGGTGVTAVSVGPITQFGSIFVNGVEHDLTHATIVVNGTTVTGSGDGNQIAAQNLALGQVVRVEGTINADGVTGTATTVTFTDDVKGTITSYTPDSQTNPTTAQITVLGQTIVVDSGTYIFTSTSHDIPLAIGSLQQGLQVEVSGLTNNNGEIHATAVEIDNGTGGDTSCDLKGAIQGLDSGTMTFYIHQQQVDYSNAQFEGLSADQLTNGMYVEVKSQTSPVNPGTVLTATEVKLESNGLGKSDAQRAEIEGFVTSVTSPTAFQLDGQDVVTNGSTRYENGTAASVQIGGKLEVEGTLQNGILTATKISVKSSSGH